VLRVPPLSGRDFVRDDEPSGAAIAIVRESFWRTRLGSDPRAIGRTITLDGDAFEIVGIVPDYVERPSRDTEIWRVLRVPAQQKIVRGAHYLQSLGRLAPGVTVQQADQELSTIAGDLARQHPQTNARVGAAVFRLQDELSRGSRRPLLMIFVATAVLLLLACVNVSHLLLARGASRRTEIAVRAALGASRGRLARQLLVESLVLASAGAIAGALVAMWTTLGVKAVIPPSLADLRGASVDVGALGFIVVIAVVTALVFGLVPAVRMSAVPMAEVARSTSARVSPRSTSGRLLIVFQVALAAMLVVGAGLLVTSFARLQAVDPGFDTNHLVVARVALPDRTYPDGASRRRFFRQLLDRLESSGGVETAAAATRIPLRSQGANMTFTVDTAPERDLNGVIVQEMSPELIAALRLRVLRGRPLSESDGLDSPAVLDSRS
jgi:putative ABC transport system permease protein